METSRNTKATLTNYKFGSHTSFPGPCSPPANPSNTHSVQINGSFPVTFGRQTQNWNWPARKPTGTYLAPGTIASVTVPAALVNAGYKIRVGAHSWDLSGRTPVNRLERATRLFSISSTTTRIASPYGGGIYIEVPQGASAGLLASPSREPSALPISPRKVSTRPHPSSGIPREPTPRHGRISNRTNS